LNENLISENKGLANLKKIWKFAQNVEVTTPAGTIGTKSNTDNRNDQQIIDDIIYSIVSTVKGINNRSILHEMGFTQRKDGVVLLIDEADKASPELKLGSFLKSLSEILVTEDATNFLFIIAGLPELRNVLKESHESSLRLFKQLELKQLSKVEVEKVINKVSTRAIVSHQNLNR